MRTRAVITIASADDARNTACELTVPVPDEGCPARTMAAALGRGRRPLTPALLGVG
jgi:hypothetical protein